MPVYRRLAVSGIPFFKEAEFDLGTPGLSVILGLNTNDPAKLRSTNSNFVGKSLLMSQIPDIVFRDGLGGKAKDKAKGRERVLEVDTDAGSHVIRHYYKGSTEYLQILCDGKDITPTSQTAQRELAQKIIARDEMSYQVLDYLDNTKPHPLRVGDTGQRRTFFTKFFQLASADHMRKLVAAEKDALKQDGARRAELDSQLSSFTVPDPVDEELTAAQDKLKRLQSKIASMREARDHATWRNTHAAVLATIPAHIDDLTSGQEHRESLASDLKVCKAKRAAIREARSQAFAYEAYVKAKAARKTYLEEHALEDVEISAYKERLEKLRAAFDKLSEEQASAARASAAFESRTVRLREEVQDAKEALQKLLGGRRVCSSCGQPLTKDHLAKERSVLETRLQTAKASLAEHQSTRIQSDDPDAHASRVQSLRKKMRDVQHVLDLWSEAPRVPEAVEKPSSATGDEDALTDKIESLRRALENLDLALYDEHQFRTWCATRNDKVAYDNDAYDKAADALIKCQARVADLQARHEERKRALQTRRTLKARIEELDAKLIDYDAVLLLEKAFATSSGVKSMVIRGLCAALESQVNRYAKFLFPEDYTFKFNLDTQFDITVTRKFGKTEHTSDVRKLSGAEAGLFNILLVVALTTFLPKSHRSNLLILDEVDANFSPAMTEAFIRFLPVLNKAIPHIVVITPKSADYGENARYFTVVKKGSVSRILPGRPAAVAQQLSRKK